MSFRAVATAAQAVALERTELVEFMRLGQAQPQLLAVWALAKGFGEGAEPFCRREWLAAHSDELAGLVGPQADAGARPELRAESALALCRSVLAEALPPCRGDCGCAKSAIAEQLRGSDLGRSSRRPEGQTRVG